MIILFPNTKMTRQRSKAKPEVFNVQVIDPIRLRVDVSDVTRQAHTLTSDYKAVRLVHQEKFTSKQAINAFCLLTWQIFQIPTSKQSKISELKTPGILKLIEQQNPDM